jgi:hypothetical protein
MPVIAHRENQREKLRRALEEAPYSAQHPSGKAWKWLGVDAIMRLGIAQYNSRLHELRRAGFEIENYREWDDQAQAYKSWYRIVQFHPAVAAVKV